jgi:hypothetical protein
MSFENPVTNSRILGNGLRGWHAEGGLQIKEDGKNGDLGQSATFTENIE